MHSIHGISTMGSSEFQTSLKELNPKRGLSNLIGRLLASCTKPGWFRYKMVKRIQVFFHPKTNIFRAQTTKGIPFVGDFRDIDTWYWMTMPEHDDHIVDTIINEIQKHDGIFIDVGANVGLISTSVLLKLPDIISIAVEPIGPTAKRAAGTMALNGISNCTLVNAAVGEANGSLKLKYSPSYSGWTSVHSIENMDDVELITLDVPVYTLDYLVSELGVTKISFIKIDVEGHEMAVLMGARSIIRDFAPTFLVEFNPPLAKKAGWNPDDAVAVFSAERPYRATVILPDGERIPYDQYDASDEKMIDLLFVPID